MRALVICHLCPELTTRFRFLELGDLDVSHAAFEALHLVAQARRLDWENGHTPPPFLMELLAPKQFCSAGTEKMGVPGGTMDEGFHDLSSDPDAKFAGSKQAEI